MTSGLLCRAFARLRCESCVESRLVAFSCKGHGFCPSCMGRRVCATTPDLVERSSPRLDLSLWTSKFQLAAGWLICLQCGLMAMETLTMTNMPKDSLEGGCHCGLVRLRVAVDRYEALHCNCSICTKKGNLHVIVDRSRFELVAGQESLTTYTFGTHTAKHTFCATCGMHPFYVPRSHPGSIDVNARCLDGDALERFRIVPFDGRLWEENVGAIR